MSVSLERLWQAIDPKRLEQHLLALLDIYSPSGKEEDVQLYLEEVLHRAGFAVQRQSVEEDRYNLLVTMGAAPPRLVLVGHVDTIPAWDLEAYGAHREGDLVRGLGSADMKGGCAAMLEAWLALGQTLPPEQRPPVGLLLAVGEEEAGDGSARFLQEHAPEWVVIGEPTGLSACFAHYGYLETRLVTRGRRTHSSLPELGHNAIESMLRVLLEIGRDPLFRRRQQEVVYSIRELSSSQAGFVVPDRCEAWIDLHLHPGLAPDEVRTAIERRAAQAHGKIAELDLEIDFAFSAAGYQLGTDLPLAGSLETLYRRLELPLRFDAFRSHSDGNQFFAAGCRPLILGPGQLEVAHTPDEQTSLAEVLQAARIYAGLCLELTHLTHPAPLPTMKASP